MNSLRGRIQLALAILAFCNSSAYGAPRDSVSVTFASDGSIERSPETGVVRCDILFCDELWYRSRIWRDETLGRAIGTVSHAYGKMVVLVGVNNPVQTSVADISKTIDRLKRLIAENSRADCAVEITVFPMHMPEDTSTPVSPKAAATAQPTPEKAKPAGN
jgi:hypothetical protein